MVREARKEKMRPATLRRKITVASPWLSILQFDLAEDFHFKPGQYVTLGLDAQTELAPRPYSIASSPYESRFLEFYINMVNDGEFSSHLSALKPGEPAWYEGPKGEFTLDRTSRKSLFMIATGTGLAPFISMIRKLQRESQPNGRSEYNLVVMHGVSHSADLGYRSELEAWNRQRDRWLFYLPTISRPHSDPYFQPQWAQGRVNDLLRSFLGESKTGSVEPRPGNGTDMETVTRLLDQEPAFYLCGNPKMVNDAKDILARHGFTEIFTEGDW